MNQRPLILLGVVMLAACGGTSDSSHDETDNLLLGLVLQALNTQDDRYLVVHPTTELPGLTVGDDPDDLARTQQLVREALQIHDELATIAGEHLDRLVAQLVERNRETATLSLASSPQDGYVVDHDGDFAAYFGEVGGGWDRWYADHPGAAGRARVSLPAHDPATGLVLVYCGIQSGWLAGSGNLYLFRYEERTLTMIGRVALWIS
jgi:hypothetical protein